VIKIIAILQNNWATNPNWVKTNWDLLFIIYSAVVACGHYGEVGLVNG